MNKYTLADFESEFPDDNVCLEWILSHRYPNGVHCPICDKVTKHHKVAKRPCYECDNCGHQVYPTAGTIFHKSTTPLKVWFQVIYRMASTRCGISAKQIERETGVTYKTAWRMFKQVRILLSENFWYLTGEVEVDETYIGGKRSGKRGRGAEGKTKVVGAVQRKGSVTTAIVPDVKRSTLTPFIEKNVSRKSILYTDEFQSYDHLTKLGYNHFRIQHGIGQYVRGSIHTNNIEGFWSLMKRGISGVYHAVSPKYLQYYIDEYAFRYNHRRDEIPMFKLFLNRIQA